MNYIFRKLQCYVFGHQEVKVDNDPNGMSYCKRCGRWL